MAVDLFLKLDGIPGESTDARHKDEIELEAFGWGLSNQHPAGGGGGGGAGKPLFQPLSAVMRTSRAAPPLVLACASGQHLKTAVVTARKSGGQQQDYLVIKLSDVLVSSYHVAGSEGSDAPTDQVTLEFARIEIEYRALRPDGSLAPPVRAGWDVKTNKKV
ncbi:MAG: Hcp family type VI secretion system effector [Pseudomonadota bacterium]